MAILCILLAAAVFLTDWLLKRRVEETMRPGERRELAGGKLVLRRSHNKGMAMNLLDERPGLVRAVRLVLLFVLTVWFLKTLISHDTVRKKAALAIVTGGAWNNVVDQLKNGAVTDYLSFGKGKIMFNLSDFALIGGGIWLMLQSIAGNS